MRASTTMLRRGAVAVAAVVVSMSMVSWATAGSIAITEWMYKGTNGEFVEFTNMSSSEVDMTNWSYSDTDKVPGDVSFGGVFGLVQPGESVIFTETAPAAFRTAWGLASSVKVFGPNANSNLGNGDEIHLYDAALAEVDSLIFGTTPRTEYKSVNIPFADLGLTTASTSWPLSSVPDSFLSWASSGGDIGTPGTYPVPEPSSIALLFAGLLSLACYAWRKR